MDTLEVIEAGTRPSLDEAFEAGLREFLTRHGIDAPVRVDEPALTRVVIVRDEQGTLLGGGRVHQRHAKHGFPAQWTLRHFVEQREHVRARTNDAVEIAGLWATTSAQRSGIARLIAQGCLASAKAMGKTTAFTIGHTRFEQVLRAVGLAPVLGLGEVPYPTPSYAARLYNAELAKLPGATRHDRDVITTIVENLALGPAPMPLHELASIEHGCPSWTVKRKSTKLRAAC
ncbi:MAG TPA: hypothetical protein VG755_34365 [Nannocystaceae bacterium]|nr:hypothetical protein [Nannocystaceae bacterium]